MPRLPYLDAAAPGTSPLADAIRTRRGGELLHLDRMLLHSPPFAAGWNEFLGKVRSELDVPPRLLELAICVVAVANAANYEFVQHAPLLEAAGATRAQLEALPAIAGPDADVSAFDDAERAVIALTLELTRDAALSDATFAAAREQFPRERDIVELVGVIAAYNMVSRFLVAFDIEPE